MISYSQWHSIRQAAKDEHLDALERVGITTMESHYFYMNEHGFSGYPSYLWSHHGPSAGTMALRTRYGLLQGKVPYETLKFGPTGERIFYGARYDVNGTNFIMFRNLGQRELPMRVAVSGNPELELFDCFGNMYTETAVDGEAVLQTSTLAAYIRLKAGQSVDMIPLDMGANLATTANFSYSTNFTGNLEQLIMIFLKLFILQTRTRQSGGVRSHPRKVKRLKLHFPNFQISGGSAFLERVLTTPSVHCWTLIFCFGMVRIGRWQKKCAARCRSVIVSECLITLLRHGIWVRIFG
jgi:hypothetical protein